MRDCPFNLARVTLHKNALKDQCRRSVETNIVPAAVAENTSNAALKKTPLPSNTSGHGFRFEAGSYGGPGRRFMPAVICYKSLGEDQWADHFCLVNTSRQVDTENAASALAEADLAQAHSAKIENETDAAFAMSLKEKGYRNVEGFRRAVD
jgi:hypothetical protein